MSSFTDDPLLFSVVIAGVVGLVLAIAYVAYVKCYRNHQVGAPNPALIPVDNDWVDVTQFNGDSAAAFQRPRVEDVRGGRTSVGNRTSASRNAPIVPKLRIPTDQSFPLNEFKRVLEFYYSKYTGTMTYEDLDVVLATYGGTTAARRELSAQLRDEYGEELDTFYHEMESGVQPRPRVRIIASPGGATPGVQVVGTRARDGGPALSLSTDLASALEARGMGRYYDVLKANGINSVHDFGGMSEDIIQALFPADLQPKVMGLVNAARLLGGDDDEV